MAPETVAYIAIVVAAYAIFMGTLALVSIRVAFIARMPTKRRHRVTVRPAARPQEDTTTA